MTETFPISYELPEVQVRLAEGKILYSDQPMNSPKRACEVMTKVLSEMDREYLCVVNLDSQLRPINYNVVSIGGLDSALAPMSNVYKTAILSNASAIILLHNHPSGSLQPSAEDIRLTQKVEMASKIMDIRLLDHIIVAGGTGKQFSFQENGLLGSMHDLEHLREKSEKYHADYKSRMQDITEQLKSGIEELQSSEKYKHYLTVMGRFHRYSANNCLLIAMQNPEATRVAGYSAWKKEFQRHVKRGEKGIKIIAPASYSVPKKRVKCDPETGKPVLDRNGNAETEVVNVMVENYKVTTVFDVTQTEGKELPELVHELQRNVSGYKKFLDAIQAISPVPVEFSNMPGSKANGYYDQWEKKIVIRFGMSEAQTVKTAVHELGHAILHDKDSGSQKECQLDRMTKEVQAESVAYTVCQHYGIDTSEYSFGYVSGWCKDHNLSDLKTSLSVIQKTAAEIIDRIDGKIKENQKVEDLVQETAEKLSLENCFKPERNVERKRCR